MMPAFISEKEWIPGQARNDSRLSFAVVCHLQSFVIPAKGAVEKAKDMENLSFRSEAEEMLAGTIKAGLKGAVEKALM